MDSECSIAISRLFIRLFMVGARNMSNRSDACAITSSVGVSVIQIVSSPAAVVDHCSWPLSDYFFMILKTPITFPTMRKLSASSSRYWDWFEPGILGFQYDSVRSLHESLHRRFLTQQRDDNFAGCDAVVCGCTST